MNLIVFSRAFRWKGFGARVFKVLGGRGLEGGRVWEGLWPLKGVPYKAPFRKALSSNRPQDKVA